MKVTYDKLRELYRENDVSQDKLLEEFFFSSVIANMGKLEEQI